ncbi:(Fe-S)-binding protein [Lysobacter sp. FW306-1B-D06B]|uniref:(Fe-S)-binding protein n=1 Tax=Lysobacter sp. FW306-1B-D06B TaxID=3140250 RepID=UPI00314005EE
MPPATPSPRPAVPDPLVALADRCVQCGLCLPACPTYGEARIEAESPRGRIALARAWALEAVEETPAGEAHLDHCLGCRSCEAVCPAGVRYGALLVEARTRQRKRRPAGLRQHAIEALAARPTLLTLILRVYGLLHPLLPAAWRPLPAPPPRPSRQAAPAPFPGDTALFVGCAADAYESEVRAAVSRCLAQLGIQVSTPPGQGCCGSLHAHAGNATGAAALRQQNLRAFASARTVLTFASGCHEAVAEAMPASTRTVDAVAFLAEQLAARAGTWQWRTGRERIALHLPCTQRNVVRSAPSLRALLSAVPELEVVELDANLGCCGASGTQMLEDPERAASFRAPLLRQLAESGATRLLSANLGCRLHLANGTRIPVQHPLVFLAERLETVPSPRPPSGDA